jgi:hypothetical protein
LIFVAWTTFKIAFAFRFPAAHGENSPATELYSLTWPGLR